jgi:protein required for attachment to host cells
MNTWIVSANAGRARFFVQERAVDLPQQVAELQHPQSRQRDSEIESDDLGERAASKTRHGSGMPETESSYQPHQSPVEHEKELFAREIADYLRKAHQEGRFGELCLAASPDFLGLLRKHLDPHVLEAVRIQVNKDYTQFSGQQLLQQLERDR